MPHNQHPEIQDSGSQDIEARNVLRSDVLEVTIADKIAHIQLARPEKGNAFAHAFWNDFPAIIRHIDKYALARVIVISAQGKHFTAGMDLSVFASGVGPQHEDKAIRAEGFRQFVALLQQSFSCLDGIRIPVICAIHGACVGAGVDMVSAADMRFATKDAFLAIEEINIGMMADVGTFPRLAKLIPDGLLRELAYSGRRLSAEEGLRAGLINQLFDTHEEMMAHVMGLSAIIAQKDPLAIAGTKRIILYSRDHSVADTLDYVATWQAGMFSPDHMAKIMMTRGQNLTVDLPDLAPILDKM